MDNKVFVAMQLAELESDVRSLKATISSKADVLKAEMMEHGETEETATYVVQTVLADVKVAQRNIKTAGVLLRYMEVPV